MTGLFIRYEMVKAMSATEGLLFTAGKIFGSSDEGEGEDLNSVADMQAFERMINGG